MKNFKNTKGITLIALVITIIVLIILAGVSINLILGNNGIVERAKEGRDRYANAAAYENEQLTNVDSYLGEITGEITGESSTPTAYTQYTLGQEVTVRGEKFFVIEENDTTSKETITLITKYNLDPSSNTQLNEAYESTSIAFCTDPDNTWAGYWASISEITYPYELNGVESERATVYNKAVAYGSAKGGTGRLLTRTEVETLTAEGKIPEIIYGKNYTTNPVTTDNYLNFWLSTTNEPDGIDVVQRE